MLRSAPVAATVFAIVDDVAQRADACTAQSPSPRACTAACAFCCYLPVDVTAPEALRIAAYLRQTLSPETFAALRNRLAEHANQISGLSYEDHSRARIPCALLHNGTCRIYPHRPLACRAWNSASRNDCEHIFEQGDPVTMLPPLDMQAYEAVWELARGMTDGLQQARLDSNTYELHSILLRALEVPDAIQCWLRHDDVFVGCTVGAFTD